jgi:hypothetical protein
MKAVRYTDFFSMHKFEMIKFFCIDNSSQQRELSTSITSTPPDNNILVVSDQINAGENHSLI